MVVVQGQVNVGQGLRFHALGGVHHQQGAFAGRQGARNFVIEVHMAGRINEVKLVGAAVGGSVGNAHGLRLNGDAALTLQVHPVQILLAGLTLADHVGQFQNAVGQGGFTMVDVGNDAKIADVVLFGHGVFLRPE